MSTVSTAPAVTVASDIAALANPSATAMNGNDHKMGTERDAADGSEKNSYKSGADCKDVSGEKTTPSSDKSSNVGGKKSPNAVAGATTPSPASTSFQVGPCLLGKHCFAPTHEL